MKKIVCTILLTLFSVLMTEQALAIDGLYFGHAVGGYQIGDRLNLTDSTGNTLIRSSGTYVSVAGQLFAGYSFTVQEHVTAAIQFDGFLQAGSFNPFYVSNTVSTIKIDEKVPYYYTISAIPTWEITKISRILLKLGYTRGYFEMSASSPTTSQDKNQWRNAFNAGIGTELAVTETIDFRLMASTDLYQKKEVSGIFTTLKATVVNSRVMLGLVYHTDLMG